MSGHRQTHVRTSGAFLVFLEGVGALAMVAKVAVLFGVLLLVAPRDLFRILWDLSPWILFIVVANAAGAAWVLLGRAVGGRQ